LFCRDFAEDEKGLKQILCWAFAPLFNEITFFTQTVDFAILIRRKVGKD
jgi:hypothetical protein